MAWGWGNDESFHFCVEYQFNPTDTHTQVLESYQWKGKFMFLSHSEIHLAYLSSFGPLDTGPVFKHTSFIRIKAF